MKSNTNLAGRKCYKINKPVSDICRIVAILSDAPRTTKYLAKHLNLSWLYTRDLVQVLIECNAASITSVGVTLFPVPVLLRDVIEVIEEKPYYQMPESPEIADLIEHEIRDRMGEIDLTQFTGITSLHRPRTDSQE